MRRRSVYGLFACAQSWEWLRWLRARSRHFSHRELTQWWRYGMSERSGSYLARYDPPKHPDC